MKFYQGILKLAGYFLPCKMVVYEMLIGLMGYDDLGDVASEVESILIEAIDAAV